MEHPESPLAPYLAGGARRAAFSVRRPGETALDDVGGLLAGAAVADITPPPGLPKAGYSANAHTGSGFRGRLRARIVHLRSGRRSIAVVACDLLGGSSVVQRLVAERIRGTTDVPLGGLFIGATHTHAGPGQFLGTDFYNRFASNRSGFDPAWTEFLVTEIADAVERAVDDRVPAVASFGSAEVWGLTRNRSLEPYVQNVTIGDKRLAPQRKYVSVNPWLHLLRVDSRRTDREGPLAALAVFSVHGTGVSMTAREYNADLWAYLVGELDHRIESTSGRRAVVGAIEGTHADVAPALRPGLAGHLEAERIGRGIGAAAAELHGAMADDLDDSMPLDFGFEEVDLRVNRRGGGVELPARPAVGAALVAGATENTTPVISKVPGFRAGTPKPWAAKGPHGRKWVLGSRWLQPLVLPLRGFPRVLPIQVLRLGDTALVGLPFEITVESGRRIADAVDAALGATDGDSWCGRVVVSSVANEYSGYAATAEEYERQYYEGGHTLYGPATVEFLAGRTAALAGAMDADGGVTRVGSTREWDLSIGRFLPAPTGREVHRRSLGDPTFHDPGPNDPARWTFRWHDVAPGDLRWHEPLVRVEQRDRRPDTTEDREWDDWRPAVYDGRPVDDQHWNVEVRWLGPATDSSVGHEYEVSWHDPGFRGGREHRFVLLANAGTSEFHSAPFD